jgi:preprotein translocase subunit SecD
MIYFAKWKIAFVFVVCALGLLFAAPNLLNERVAKSLPDIVPHKQINLGLDLRGGAHLLYEVNIESVIDERLSSIVDDLRSRLRKAHIGYRGLGVEGTAVVFTLREPEKLAEARRIASATEQGAQVENNGNQIRVQLTDEALRDLRTSLIERAIAIVKRRIDELGVTEPTVQRQGTSRILVQVPGVNPERLKAIVGKTAKMTFHLVDVSMTAEQAQIGRPPPGSMLVPDQFDTNPDGGKRQWLVRKRAMLKGERLVDASASVAEGRPQVNFRFDATGGRRFGNVTRRNVGRPFAIVLDGEVISAPVIQEPILGGTGRITGNFSVQSANDLGLLLRAGALPADLTVLEERSVGAEMGADSIRAGQVASVLAIVLVIVFMAAAYGMFGFMADVALLFNMILIAAGLSALQATLTLPGIAGIVLTVGMAVDANVLIFERIREEQRAGRTPISAVDAGYGRALTTIIDANITTFMAAALLFIFGSGPIKGFAVTLMIGLATSMFTAIWVTRLLVVTWLRKRRPQRLPI